VNRIPYVIDNIAVKLADVLNELLAGQPQLDIATVASILKDFVQQQALAIIDKPVAEEQNIVANILREHANNPALDRNEIRELRKFLKQPLVGVSIQTLRTALKHYSANSSPDALLETLRILRAEQGQVTDETPSTSQRITLTRADLHLACYEYISA